VWPGVRRPGGRGGPVNDSFRAPDVTKGSFRPSGAARTQAVSSSSVVGTGNGGVLVPVMR
jgi:hypothetical protein